MVVEKLITSWKMETATTMTEQTGPEKKTGQTSGLGLARLSMNEIAPSEQVAEDDLPRRGGRVWLTVIVVLVAVTAVAFTARLIGGITPGQQIQTELQQALEQLPAWQHGDIMRTELVTGSALKLEFAGRLRTAADEDRTIIRTVTMDAFKLFAEKRPGRDLTINGYQGTEQIVWGQYRFRSTLIGPGGEQLPDFVIKVKGDPEGGLQEAYSGTRGSRGGK